MFATRKVEFPLTEALILLVQYCLRIIGDPGAAGSVSENIRSAIALQCELSILSCHSDGLHAPDTRE